MRTIAIINQKGGCGKTTTSINLAACLARLGRRTILVDMDPQGHCGVGLAVPEEQIERTIYDALIEAGDGKPVRIGEMVWQIASDFDLAPSNLKLAAFEQIFAGRNGREDRLSRALDSIRETYEWCVIDCPPSVGLITFNALRACDEVIVPVETGYFSLHGLTKMMETLELLKEKYNKHVVIRVLPTLYDTRTKLAREVLSELRAKFKDYLMESTVNFNTKLKEAASFGQPITEYDPGSRGYKDFLNLSRELMGHRPAEVEPVTNERLSRPAELVQRAKHLAQLTNAQFGRGSVTFNGAGPLAHAPAPGMFGGSSAAPASAGASAPSNRAPAASPFFGNSPVVIPPSNDLAMPRIAHDPPRSTQQKIDEFYGVRQMGGEVVFAVRFDAASQVQVAGDFNGWSPMASPLQSNSQGKWTLRLPLRPGRYRYRLVVDGQWMTDPNNMVVETNQFGELNNVIEVPEVSRAA
ncbi:MAG TPA: AAA family ATPase [Tepidisphaeraceae bacterium]|jgi:chromosome partitioning protein|nr:AAA family ATPase [Tepidisphaeraceae bacterium]